MRRTPSASDIGDAQATVPNHQDVDRLRPNRVNERFDRREIVGPVRIARRPRLSEARRRPDDSRSAS